MNLIKLLVLIALVILSPTAMAQVESEETLNIMQSIFSVQPGYLEGRDFDYQHRYLASLFGSFIFQIWGGGGDTISPLSYAIGFVNIIAMLLAVITFLYVYLLGAIGTASDASLMGKENSATIIPIRTAMGFGLLLPVPGIGGGVFSTIQLVIIWIIVTGSNAASVMWYGVVDYIVQNPDHVLSTSSIDETLPYEFAKMLSCAAITQTYAVESGARRSRDLTLTSYYNREGDPSLASAAPPMISTQESRGWFGVFRRAGNPTYTLDTPNYAQSIMDNPNFRSMKFADGACGEIVFPVASDLEGEDFFSAEYAQALNVARIYIARVMDKTHEGAVMRIVNEFEDYNRIREEFSSGESGRSSDLDEISRLLSGEASTLRVFLTSALNTAFTNDVNSSVTKNQLRDKLAYGGWMNSIIWFYERAAFTSGKAALISQINDLIHYPGAPNLCNAVNTRDNDAIEACATSQEQLELAERTFDSFLVESELTGEHAVAKMRSACPFGVQCSANITTASDITNDASGLLSAGLLSLISGHDVTSRDGRTNPFTVMSDLGHRMNWVALGGWAGVGLAQATFGALKDKFTVIANNASILAPIAAIPVFLKSFIYNITLFVAASIFPVVAGIMANGFVLAYVVPFMPVLTWIAMLIGYLMMVIEAVIAAPLAVVMMFTPEGRGIMGTRLQSAINLVNACTLRPMLMTLGVLAGVQLSYVSFEILNTFFWQVAANYLHGGPFDFFAVLILYTTACYQICKLIVSAIPRLPDQIMQWMSAGVGRAFGESETMNNEAAVSKLSSSAGTALGGGTKSHGLMRNDVGEKKEKPKPGDNPEGK